MSIMHNNKHISACAHISNKQSLAWHKSKWKEIKVGKNYIPSIFSSGKGLSAL